VGNADPLGLRRSDSQISGSQTAAPVEEEESPAVLAAVEAAVASSQPDAAPDEASPAPLPALPSMSAIPPVSAVYPKLPPLPSSQPTRASQRRAPALSDLSQRSKAEFAVAGSNHGTPNGWPGPKGRASLAGPAASSQAASQPSQGVFGKLGLWLAGSGSGGADGSSSQANGGKADDSDSSSSSDSDSSSDDDRPGAKVAKSRLARPALGRKKKSLLGAL
jgi:hypothetical protein